MIRPIPFRVLSSLHDVCNLAADVRSPALDDGVLRLVQACADGYGRSLDDFLDLVAAAGPGEVLVISAETEPLQ